MQGVRYKILVEFDSASEQWVTHVPALENISTFGISREQALEKTRELILGYLEAVAKEGLPAGVDGPETELVDLEVNAA